MTFDQLIKVIEQESPLLLVPSYPKFKKSWTFYRIFYSSDSPWFQKERRERRGEERGGLTIHERERGARIKEEGIGGIRMGVGRGMVL